jgi:hypothetical protein
MRYVLDEFGHLAGYNAAHRLDIYPFGEFVYHYQDVLVATPSNSGRANRFQTPHCKGIRWMDGSQGLSRQMLLLGEELVPFTSLNEVLGITLTTLGE